ncbi:hypothetical protein HPP92_025929 [Vanilla planifolia]|uniref:AP180 N-terminal homology (ANTH) domain-containing protein n=1 Tax=Vanilla planifolia TaxID=51239 RepID=A0A835QH21_VANPL|nr:hypothetical protein HPP92_025929 [Vanilla planifolia]KAG0469469.1 hypothetical protein HPP92_016169 [Vanilla planifolia]
MQEILDILVQIRPYADGMEVGLILEAMDCALIEIFEVYSCICSAIASFLVTVLGPSSSAEERRRKGVAWMKILRRAAEQSKRLSAYFDLCRTLGVINASLIPSIETVPEEDIRDLEDFVLGGFHGMIDTGRSESVLVMTAAENKNWEEPSHRQPGTVVSNEWVLFEDIKPSPPRTPPYSVLSYGNPFLCLDDDEKKTVVTRLSWAAAV